jgi:hypothetical protein
MAQVNVQDLASGTWLLLGAGENPERKHVHGVQLVFRQEIDGLRGAIVKWKTGDEIPLASLHFDGSALRVQMQPDEDYAGEVPVLTMQLVEDRFEGYWMNSNGERMHGPQAPKLKLVRYQH